MEHAHVVTHTYIYTHTQQCVLHRACTRTHTHTYIPCTRTHAPNYTPLHICTFMCAARSITRTHTHIHTNTQNPKNKTTWYTQNTHTQTHKHTHIYWYQSDGSIAAHRHHRDSCVAHTNKQTHTHWYHTNGFIAYPNRHKHIQTDPLVSHEWLHYTRACSHRLAHTVTLWEPVQHAIMGIWGGCG